MWRGARALGGLAGLRVGRVERERAHSGQVDGALRAERAVGGGVCLRGSVVEGVAVLVAVVVLESERPRLQRRQQQRGDAVVDLQDVRVVQRIHVDVETLMAVADHDRDALRRRLGQPEGLRPGALDH